MNNKPKSILLFVLMLGTTLFFSLSITSAPQVAGFSGTYFTDAFIYNGSSIIASPIVDDLDYDGNKEIIFMDKGNSSIVCISGVDGSWIWETTVLPDMNWGIASAELDTNYVEKEIIVPQANNITALYGNNGSIKWSYITTGTISNKVAVGDVNGDLLNEVVVLENDGTLDILNGTNGFLLYSVNISNYGMSPPFTNPVIFYGHDSDTHGDILVADSIFVKGINGTDGSQLWSVDLGDINPNLQPIVGSFDLRPGYYKNEIVLLGSDTISVVDTDGNFIIKQINIQYRPTTDAAVADIDKDGYAELVYGAGDDGLIIYSLKYMDVQMMGNNKYPAYSAPALADFDGDGDIEILGHVNITSGPALYSFSTSLQADDATPAYQGNTTQGIALGPSVSVNDGVIVTDVDGDGLLEAIVTDIWGNLHVVIGTGNEWAVPGPWPMIANSPQDRCEYSDSDHDWLTDDLEIMAALEGHTYDGDGDTMADGWEIVYGFNPKSNADKTLDEDNDGLENYEEFSYGTNPYNNDTDLDGLDDYYEVEYGIDPCLYDSDGDGISDGDEVNIYGTNPNEMDTDLDALTDFDELFNLGTDPCKVDTDDDGLSDYDELHRFNTDPLVNDTDDDGVLDGIEGQYGSDPAVNDTDDDGVLDGDEIYKYGTDPTAPDTDADGLSDGDEIYIFGTNPNEADTDGGGMNDGDEVNAGKDPLNSDDDGGAGSGGTSDNTSSQSSGSDGSNTGDSGADMGIDAFPMLWMAMISMFAVIFAMNRRIVRS